MLSFHYYKIGSSLFTTCTTLDYVTKFDVHCGWEISDFSSMVKQRTTVRGVLRSNCNFNRGDIGARRTKSNIANLWAYFMTLCFASRMCFFCGRGRSSQRSIPKKFRRSAGILGCPQTTRWRARTFLVAMKFVNHIQTFGMNNLGVRELRFIY